MKKLLVGLTFSFSLFTHLCSAQYTDLLNFDGNSNPYGASPFYCSLILSGTTLYGMTYGGGANGDGCVFSFNTSGNVYTDLLDFDGTNGANPVGSLSLSGTTLYGMTYGGGANGDGCVFSFNTSGDVYTDLLDFDGTNGETPYGFLTLSGTTLYGMTAYGGANGDGCVFSFNTSGNVYTDLLNFDGTNGANPVGSLSLSGTTLYGMTHGGGANGDGCVFSFNTSGNVYTDLLDFDGTNGANPNGSLSLSGTTLYGMTHGGGANGDGCVFSFNTSGDVYTDLLDFDGTNGANPYGSLSLSGTTLYGMTHEGGANGDGCVFSFNTSGDVYTDLLDFDGTNGANPYGSLSLSGTTLYGMTHGGGANGYGVVFSYALLNVTTIDTVNVTCNGANTGSSTASVSGGAAPYTYQWNDANSQTTAMATGLVAGTYTVYIWDNNGVPDSASVSISQPDSLSTVTISAANITCNGGTVSATANVSGGTTPYTYLWSNGEATATATGLVAGTYSVSVKDACGTDSLSKTITITQPNQLGNVIASVTSNVTCIGTSSGSAMVSSPSGGTTPYTYMWSNGESTASATGLSAGTYNVSVKDNCGADSISATITITQPSQLGNVIASVTSNVTCNGTNSGVAMVSSPSGGTTPYTYLWSDASSQNTATATGLSAGTYSVSIMDACGADSIATVVITQPNALKDSVSFTNIACNGGTTNATANVSGGSTPYTYAWSDANSQTTATATGLVAGTYTVSVMDACGADSIATVVITQPGQLQILSLSLASDTVNFAAVSAIQNWTVPIGNTQIQIVAAGAAGGLVLSGWGNPGNGAVINGYCNVTPGDVLNIVTGEVGGSNGGFSAGGGGGSFVWNASTTNLYIAAAGGGSGLNFDNGGNGGTDLIGNSTTQDGDVTCSAGGTGGNGGVGGTGSATYGSGGGGAGWLSNGGTAFGAAPGGGGNDMVNGFYGGGSPDGAPGGYGGGGGGGWGGGAGGGYNGGGGGTNASAYLAGGGGGSYLNGTVAEAPVDSNTQNGFVTIYYHSEEAGSPIVTQNVTCYGGNNGIITVTSISGGTSPYTYAWSDAGSQSTASATGLTAGSYTVSVMDANGCSTTGSVVLTQPNALSNIALVSSSGTCYGTGSASASLSGGTTPYTYTWSNGETTDTITGLSAGTYSVSIMDACGADSLSKTVTITQPAMLSNTNATVSANEACFGDNGGSASVSPSGGSLPYTYSWVGSSGTVGTSSAVSGLVAGTYTLNVMDGCGADSMVNITITQPELLYALIDTTNVTCHGNNNGAVTSEALGGTTPYTYSWSGGAGTNANATGLVAGTYTLTIHDYNSCLFSTAVTITQPELVGASPAITDVSCRGDHTGSISSNVSGGTSPYTYAWTGGAGTNADATGLAAGTYSLSVTDSHGCTYSTSVTVTQPGSLLAATTSSNINCNGNTDGSISATVTGGTSPYMYAWTPGGGSNSSASNLTVGTYTLTVTDACGNSATASAAITQPTAVVITTDSTVETATNNGTVTVSASGGTAPYTYMWNDANSQITATATGLSAGSYCCTVSDANGCGQTVCVTVTSTLGIANITNASNINIYPNPTIGNFTITGVTQGQVIELYDYIGQKLSSTTVSNNTTMHFDISTHANGVYLIRILNADGSLATEKKMIKTQ